MRKTYSNQPHNPQNTQAIFTVIGLLYSAIIWGIIWYPYRILAQSGISGIAATIYCYLMMSLIASIFFLRYRHGFFKLPPNIVFLSLAAGWTNLAYVLAVIDGEVMRVMLLFYLSPLWTLLLAHFWLKEKTTIRGYIAISIAVLGAFLMLYNPDVSSVPLPKNTAEWLALSAGIAFALTNVISRKSQHLSLQAKSYAVWIGVLGVSLLTLPFTNQVIPSPDQINTAQWGIIFCVSVLLFFATILVQYGVTRIPAMRASLIFLFELVVAAIASYYLAHEAMGINEWLGGGLIVIGAIISATEH